MDFKIKDEGLPDPEKLYRIGLALVLFVVLVLTIWTPRGGLRPLPKEKGF